MGRPRKTAEEQELRGNPGKRPLAVAPAQIIPALDVMPPVKVSPDAMTVWMMLAPALIDMKILRQTDALTFSIFCESFARYARALVQLRKEGDVQWVKTVSGDKMRRVNPRARILKDERDVVLKYAEKFGLTPVDRAKVMHYFAAGILPPANPVQPGAHGADEDSPLFEPEDGADRQPGSLQNAGPVGALN